MLRLCLLISLLSVGFIHVGLTQSLTITGRVTDSRTGGNLPGASIRLNGTNQGTISDADGNFSLRVNTLPETPSLSISLVGYRRQTVSLTDGTQNLLVPLTEDALNLDAVVVTGQGVDISKRRLSTNISTVTRQQLEQAPTPRLEQLLQSQLPNAQVTFSGGQPGTTSFVRSRGIVSAFRNSTPVIYVDGVRVDNLNSFARLSLNLSGNLGQGAASGALADIPTENIDRIEYINGGAATTLYGSDAANGVIQIFTKRGGTGRTNVTAEVQLGAETPTTDYYVFDRTRDLLHQTGFSQLYRVGVDGGTSDFGYGVSFNMLDNTGSVIFNQNRQKRYDLRTSLSARLSPTVQYRGSFGFVNDYYRRVRNGNAGGYVGLWFAEGAASVRFGFKPNLDALSAAAYDSVRTFVHRAEQLQNNTFSVRRFQTSQGLEITPTRNLTIRATGGVDYRNSREQGVVTSAYLLHTRQTNTQGSISNYGRQFLGLTLELVGQHTLTQGDLSLVSTVGTQLFRNEEQQVAYIGQNVRDGALTIAGAGTRTSDEFALTVANYGVYVQENIGFKNRYFVEAGLRGDANSAFGESIGVQYYPKVGASYVLSDEPFFQRLVPTRLITSLKLRANVGVAGNFPTPFLNERTIVFNSLLGAQAATFGQPGNDDLKPEKTNTVEAGADIGLLSNRLSLTATYYRALTRDALFNIPPAPSTGDPSQLRNVGRIENKGVELALTIGILKSQRWDVSLRTSLNTTRNKVLSTKGTPFFALSGFSSNTIQAVVEEGKPVGFLRGRRVEFTPEGSVVQVLPQTDLGSTIPTTFGNLALNAGYRNSLRLFVTADYQMGAYAHSFDRQFRVFHGLDNDVVPARALAELGTNLNPILTNFTNLFVERTDFLKIRLIGVTYQLPANWTKKWAKAVELGFTATNPFNFVRSSFDPEASLSGGNSQDGATTGGFGYSTYYRPRQFLSSLKLRF